MRVLLLSFYFRPDLSAGAFRATALVKAIREVDPSTKIDVVTTLPNRYGSFSADALAIEQADGVIIRRIALPAHKSGMFDQSLAFWKFARQAQYLVRDQHYDLVFATSSRLMTAVLGAWVSSKRCVPLYLDLRDIFVDTIKDVLPKRTALFVKPLFDVLERWAVKRAEKVNLVSRGFSEYFESRYPQQKFSYYTNGIDDDFLTSQPVEQQVANHSLPLRVLYAGNIGEGQGLHAILPVLGKRLQGRIQFIVIGDGGRKDMLRAALELAGVSNVELLPPMARDQLIEEYKLADVLFLHLNNYDAFRKVLPSKLFEYAAMGKPIWAGVPGYSAEFVRAEVSNAAVFPPCNAVAAEQALGRLVIQDAPRKEFIKKFARGSICRELAKDILALAQD
ncbi:MAG: glycosyltransferase family 4 protein [Burkholderiales bacterium]|nr:glycosyltransferase family 4 protein [Burkholderiales bacterium]